MFHFIEKRFAIETKHLGCFTPVALDNNQTEKY